MIDDDKPEKPKLTVKQDAFALAYFETGNGAEAYRRAYDVAETSRAEWIYAEASLLLDNPKVALRVAQLEERAEKMAMFTRKRALDEYEEARQLALKEKAAAAAVSATNGKVKLFGLEPPAKTRHEVMGKDGEPIEQSITITRRIIDPAKNG